MENPMNLRASQIELIEALTAGQLDAIRHNLQEPDYSDAEVRQAMAEALADGYQLEDFYGQCLPCPPWE